MIPRVSGTARLAGTLGVTTPIITYAGQCSDLQIRGPNDNTPSGVQFLDGSHNVIVRGMKVRPGGPCPDDVGESLIAYGPASYVHDVIFDTCSLQWGTDAQVMFYGSVSLCTLQWSIVANGTNNSTTGRGGGSGKGPHFKGGYFSMHHNLISCNTQRNPLVQSSQGFDQRCNVIYNWAGNNGAEYGLAVTGDYVLGNIINNVYLAGPESQTPYFLIGNGMVAPGLNALGMAISQGSRLYTSGNIGPLRPQGSADSLDDFAQFFTIDYYNVDGSIRQCDPAIYRATSPFAYAPIATEHTDQVLQNVFARAGAGARHRDAVDQSVIDNVVSRRGCTSVSPGCFGDGGPWPDLAAGALPYPTDSNNDGVPDYIAAAYGYDVMANIANLIDPNNGYPIIENYLNLKAGDFDSGVGPIPIAVSPVDVVLDPVPVFVDPAADPAGVLPVEPTPVPPIGVPVAPIGAGTVIALALAGILFLDD